MPWCVGKADDGVHDQLARTMPGEFPAAVNVDHGRPVKGAFMIFRAFAGGINGCMLQQHHSIGGSAGNHGSVDSSLLVPSSCVIDEIRGKSDLANSTVIEVTLDVMHFRLNQKFPAAGQLWITSSRKLKTGLLLDTWNSQYLQQGPRQAARLSPASIPCGVWAAGRRGKSGSWRHAMEVRAVAAKFLTPGLDGGPWARRDAPARHNESHITQEWRILTQFRHEHLIPVHGVVRDSRGGLVLLMDHAAGGSAGADGPGQGPLDGGGDRHRSDAAWGRCCPSCMDAGPFMGMFPPGMFCSVRPASRTGQILALAGCWARAPRLDGRNTGIRLCAGHRAERSLRRVRHGRRGLVRVDGPCPAAHA